MDSNLISFIILSMWLIFHKNGKKENKIEIRFIYTLFIIIIIFNFIEIFSLLKIFNFPEIKNFNIAIETILFLAALWKIFSVMSLKQKVDKEKDLPAFKDYLYDISKIKDSREIKTLKNFLKNNKTLLVSGKQGSGKSTLVRKFAFYLKEEENYEVIQLKAWDYDKQLEPLRVFLNKLIYCNGITKESREDIKNVLNIMSQPKYIKDEGIDYVSYLKKIIKKVKLESIDTKIIFIVDELERANGNFVSELIESLTVYLGVEESLDNEHIENNEKLFYSKNVKIIYIAKTEKLQNNLPKWWGLVSENNNFKEYKEVFNKHFHCEYPISDTTVNKFLNSQQLPNLNYCSKKIIKIPFREAVIKWNNMNIGIDFKKLSTLEKNIITNFILDIQDIEWSELTGSNFHLLSYHHNYQNYNKLLNILDKFESWESNTRLRESYYTDFKHLILNKNERQILLKYEKYINEIQWNGIKDCFINNYVNLLAGNGQFIQCDHQVNFGNSTLITGIEKYKVEFAKLHEEIIKKSYKTTKVLAKTVVERKEYVRKNARDEFVKIIFSNTKFIHLQEYFDQLWVGLMAKNVLNQKIKKTKFYKKDLIPKLHKKNSHILLGSFDIGYIAKVEDDANPILDTIKLKTFLPDDDKIKNEDTALLFSEQTHIIDETLNDIQLSSNKLLSKFHTIIVVNSKVQTFQTIKNLLSLVDIARKNKQNIIVFNNDINSINNGKNYHLIQCIYNKFSSAFIAGFQAAVAAIKHSSSEYKFKETIVSFLIGSTSDSEHKKKAFAFRRGVEAATAHSAYSKYLKVKFVSKMEDSSKSSKKLYREISEWKEIGDGKSKLYEFSSSESFLDADHRIVYIAGATKRDWSGFSSNKFYGSNIKDTNENFKFADQIQKDDDHGLIGALYNYKSAIDYPQSFDHMTSKTFSRGVWLILDDSEIIPSSFWFPINRHQVKVMGYIGNKYMADKSFTSFILDVLYKGLEFNSVGKINTYGAPLNFHKDFKENINSHSLKQYKLHESLIKVYQLNVSKEELESNMSWI